MLPYNFVMNLYTYIYKEKSAVGNFRFFSSSFFFALQELLILLWNDLVMEKLNFLCYIINFTLFYLIFFPSKSEKLNSLTEIQMYKLPIKGLRFFESPI